MRKYLYTILVLFIAVVPAFAGFDGDWGTGNEAATTNSTYGTSFDFVITFDGYDDWKGDCGSEGFKTSSLPTISGGASPIDFYRTGSAGCSGGNWIDNFGAAYDARGGGKSVKLSYMAYKEPENLGVFFADTGDATPENTGYSPDVYYFFRIKYLKNSFPTSISSGTGIYSQTTYNSDGYVYRSGHKLTVFNLGREAIRLTAGCNDISVYSPLIGHLCIRQTGSEGNIYIKDETWERSYPSGCPPSGGCTSNRTGVDSGTRWSTTSLNNVLQNEKWFGVEHYLKVYNDGGQSKVQSITWIYDDSGNVIASQSPSMTYDLGCTALTDNWNEFWLVGNNSAYYYPDNSTQVSTLYIDDIIVDGSRIGPTYFSSVVGGGSPPDPSPVISNEYPTGDRACDAATDDVTYGFEVSESATCYGDTSSPSGGTQAEKYSDLVSNGFQFTASGLNYSYDTTVTCDGSTTTVYAICKDSSDQYSSTASWSFTADQSPSSSVIRPTYAQIPAAGNSIKISYNQEPSNGSVGYDCEGFTVYADDVPVSISSLDCMSDASADCTNDNLASCSGDGYDRLICNLGGIIKQGQSVRFDYTASGSDYVVACSDDTPAETLTGFYVNNDSTVSEDTTLNTPVISAPSGWETCTSDPKNVSYSFTTDEAATCSVSLDDNTYTQATTTGGTTHTGTISAGCNILYTFYVECYDAAQNEAYNTSNFLLTSGTTKTILVENSGRKTVTISNSGSKTITLQ